jgi:glycosyltransferase involved in cell wall biosynthesis
VNVRRHARVIASAESPAVRILLDYRPALRQRTGVGEYVHEVARALVATAPPGESLLLFSSSWKDRLAPDVVPGATTVDRRVPVRTLNWLWHRAGWPPAERLAAGALDVTHSAHPLILPARHAARVVTIHDLDFLDHPERTAREIRRDYPDLVADHVQRADAVVVVSRHTAGEVERRLGVPPAKMAICPPGAPAWPRRESEPASGRCLLFLGTLDPRKNLGTLLDAYEQILARRPDAPPLVLAGGITPDAAPIVSRARRAPLAGHVELTGYIDPAARAALFARALVFVLPSYMEGFGMPAVEAMVSGVPVVAANRGALPEVVGSAGYLVDAEDAAAMAQAIETLVDNPALRQQLSDAGVVQARQFSWTATAARLREVWTAAIARRRGQPHR